MKKENAIKRLVVKYGWYTNDYLGWDYGIILQKRNYDKDKDVHYVVLEIRTHIDGIEVSTQNYMVQYPIITYKELKLFKTISDYYKQMYEEQKLFKIGANNND